MPAPMLTPGFAPNGVHGYAALIIDAADRAPEAVLPPRHVRAAVDSSVLMSRLTTDVILRVLLGTPGRGEAEGVMHATQVHSRCAMREHVLARNVARCVAAARMAREAPGGAVPRAATDRGAAGDLPGRLLEARDEETGQALSDAEVHDQCMVMFQAGHETSATALLWWCWLMASHPEAQQQAHREVQQVLAGRAAQPGDLPALDWLGASLKEAMRLYPPAAGLMSRRVVKPTALGDCALPAGALLRITPWIIHRDPRWFADPEKFRPQRFVSTAEPPERGSWLPFGVGPRRCIGQHLAMREMTLVAAMLLQRFEIEPIAGEPAPSPQMHVTLRPMAPLRLRLRARRSTADQ